VRASRSRASPAPAGLGRPPAGRNSGTRTSPVRGDSNGLRRSESSIGTRGNPESPGCRAPHCWGPPAPVHRLTHGRG